ncbi:MAG: hypothetical protein C4B58_03700 [Deltaproteobacteria bacterium]|nr:MAG: hypothetical protein C4B58_03700 [Deltaproteobacteria bacterium]
MNWKQNYHDFKELFLLPGLAALLPWPICFRIFQRLSRLESLYRTETQNALAGANSIEPVLDPKAWASAYRLIRLVDHADLYLLLFRRDFWRHKYVTIDSPGWPQGNKPFLAITFHWGAGMWSLRHLRAQGKKISGLMRGFDRTSFSETCIRYWYAKLRTFGVVRAGVENLVFINGTSMFKLRKAIRSGSCVVGLFDVFVEQQRNVLLTQLFGRRACLPRGLVYLAVKEHIPVVVYTMALDRKTGHRKLRISKPLPIESENVLLNALVGQLEMAISEDPPAWHHWAGVDRFFTDKS